MDIDLVNYLLSIAVRESNLSNCQKRQYGAVVVPTAYLRGEYPISSDQHLVVAAGHNLAAGVHERCDPCLRMDIDSGTRAELCRAIHAEQMALVNAVANLGQSSLRHHAVVISGKNIPLMEGPYFYCSMCARQMAILGIDGVLVPTTNGPAYMTMKETLESACRFARGELRVSELE